MLLNLSKRVNHLLNEGKQQGVVITHGTDTIEETAFFLELTTQINSLSLLSNHETSNRYHADGPMNLLESVVLAADKKAENRGVMVVLNDAWFCFYTTKSKLNHS
ncbi:asparaginase [Providencia rettgeri]|uniref:Asparaginase n=1 Tax=Providencia rettgeri TaxID=587 RepID=A0A939SRA4_PRORE|nr:asparaginase [Providencia rettgeri]